MPLVVTELYLTCSACPVQWVGRLEDGRALYIRSRHGELSIGIGATLEDAVGVRHGMPTTEPDRAACLLATDIDEFLPPDEVRAVVAAAGVLVLCEESDGRPPRELVL